MAHHRTQRISPAPLHWLFIALAFATLTRPADAASDSPPYLLKTHWYQDGPFAQFTPDHERVGCWSTAYAQILYYHRLRPFGQVEYESSGGQRIKENLDTFRFDWDQFVDDVTVKTPKGSVEQLARYSYATAVVVRKDFGTGRYKRLLNSVEDLEAHFDVNAEIYVHLGDRLPLSPQEITTKLRAERVTNLVDQAGVVRILEKELAANRPVYFHFGNIKDFGHSTVIDGFRQETGRYQVHLNYGAVESERSRWYDLFAPITQPDDEALRAFVTIQPRPTRKGGASASVGSAAK